MKDTHSKIIFALFVFSFVSVIALFIRVNRKGVELVSSIKQKPVIMKERKELAEPEHPDVDAQLNDMEKLLDSAHTTPFKKGDDIVGFKFTDIQPDSVWTKLGIQEGDVITQVNDEVLSSPANLLNVFSDIKLSPHLKIKVIRGSEVKTLEITVK